jgi:hypothetical protein
MLGVSLVLVQHLDAQAVRLELRPRAGDTIMLRLEQQTEMIGALIGPSRDSSITIRASMLMYARAIVERSDAGGATIVAVTDSIRTAGVPLPNMAADSVNSPIEGQRVRMRVLPDGSSELISANAAVSGAVRALIAQMPATMPKGEVRVGETWTREVPFALERNPHLYAVRTVFRLDSLSSGNRLAYISMRGVIVDQKPDPEAPREAETSGDMNGRMTLDRGRGWIIDSVATMTIKAVVRRPLEGNVAAMDLQIRITQMMRTLSQR